MRKLTPNMLWLCIDQCDQTILSGYVYSIMRKEPMVFQDIDQMILQADQLFDEIGYPQSFQKKRSMKEEESKPYARLSTAPQVESDEITRHHGNCKTLVIMVTARQFANWQGYLMDEHFQRLEGFQDVMGLLHHLMEQMEQQ